MTVGGAISGYCAIGSTCDAIRPASRDDDRDDAGEYRPVDEEFGERHDAERATSAGAAPAPHGAAAGASVTGAPGRTFSRLSVITRSPAFSPDRIVQSVPTQSPICTGVGCALPSGIDDEDERRFLGLHDGGLRHEEDVVALAGVDDDVDELSRQQLFARIRELGAQLLRAELACRSAVAAKLSWPLPSYGDAVGEEHLHIERRVAADAAAGDLRQIRLGKAEAHPDRRQLVDRRQQAAVRVAS